VEVTTKVAIIKCIQIVLLLHEIIVFIPQIQEM